MSSAASNTIQFLPSHHDSEYTNQLYDDSPSPEVWTPASSVSACTPTSPTPSPPSPTPPKLTRRGNLIPRPRNAFMIFRSEFSQNKITRSVERDNRHISRIIGHCWNKLTEAEKDIWRHRAEQEKLAHAAKYPGYRFTPTSRSSRPKPVKRKVRRNGQEDLWRCEQVAELLLRGKEGDVLENEIQHIDTALANGKIAVSSTALAKKLDLLPARPNETQSPSTNLPLTPEYPSPLAFMPQEPVPTLSQSPAWYTAQGTFINQPFTGYTQESLHYHNAPMPPFYENPAELPQYDWQFYPDAACQYTPPEISYTWGTTQHCAIPAMPVDTQYDHAPHQNPSTYYTYDMGIPCTQPSQWYPATTTVYA